VLAFLGPWDFVIVAALVVFFLGSRRLAAAGRGLARGLREFKGSVTGGAEEEPKELPPPREQGGTHGP
jgi:Sec-independent protein translocase protein TatA